MKRFSLAVFSVLILWSFYIGLDGDAFTYYFSIGLFLFGLAGVAATLFVEQVCPNGCFKE